MGRLREERSSLLEEIRTFRRHLAREQYLGQLLALEEDLVEELRATRAAMTDTYHGHLETEHELYIAEVTGGRVAYCEECQNDGPLRRYSAQAISVFLERYPECQRPEPITELPDEGEHPHQWRHE